MNIETTNIHLNVIDAHLRGLFTPFGEVRTVELVRNDCNNRLPGGAVIDMTCFEKTSYSSHLTLHGTKLEKTICVIRFYSTDEKFYSLYQ